MSGAAFDLGLRLRAHVNQEPVLRLSATPWTRAGARLIVDAPERGLWAASGDRAGQTSGTPKDVITWIARLFADGSSSWRQLVVADRTAADRVAAAWAEHPAPAVAETAWIGEWWATRLRHPGSQATIAIVEACQTRFATADPADTSWDAVAWGAELLDNSAQGCDLLAALADRICEGTSAPVVDTADDNASWRAARQAVAAPPPAAVAGAVELRAREASTAIWNAWLVDDPVGAIRARWDGHLVDVQVRSNTIVDGRRVLEVSADGACRHKTGQTVHCRIADGHDATLTDVRVAADGTMTLCLEPSGDGPLHAAAPNDQFLIAPETVHAGRERKAAIALSARLRTPPWVAQTAATPAPTLSARAVAATTAHAGLPALRGVAADVLASVTRGQPAVVVQSPPGAGKTWLAAAVAGWLCHADVTVTVACQRVEQATDLACRVAEVAPAAAARTLLVGASSRRRPARLPSQVGWATSLPDEASHPGLVVATSAKIGWGEGLHNHRADVLIVDEAWQSTWAGFLAAADVAPQYVLIGDPGQIPPVVVAETDDWPEATAAHRCAPDVLLALREPDTELMRLPDTRRVGSDTVSVIAPLYPFGFGTIAPAVQATTAAGPLREVGVLIVEAATHTDAALLQAVADEARGLACDTTLHGPDGSRPATGADVMVVVPHRAQATGVRARLADLPDIIVDTADAQQGREAALVVFLDALAGKHHAGEFELDTGRLCVGLSRHTHHVTVVTSAAADRLVQDATGPAALLQRDVRARLGAVSGQPVGMVAMPPMAPPPDEAPAEQDPFVSVEPSTHP